ncbi:multiple organellar RNA editing factor 8, chloroplastic/mitochondrial-like isoform X1 [Chenopodium quinoa]|uniref:multiple organellar RNA editing factor 8, chloroplastic/mitochondrial-like isoform X1 n=1 Tax=Chenopodium quinoa TaxID=63459 RepID=UPI000B779B2F|nr:multiple organellar RNA editing factor 8, chloroplastic/mitochondrial-like isoform X1 [Chenopodium quinoa]
MAAPRILSPLSRTLFTKQSFASFLLSRPFSSSTTTTTTSAAFSLLRLRPLASAAALHRYPAALTTTAFRTFATRQAQNSLSDNNPNWSNRPPKETILLDGCDFEHWLVVTESPPENATRDEIIDSFVKTLAEVIGSEEEARMKIYSVSTRHYFAFGALVSEELTYKLKELPNVRWVLPDSYLDVKNKDYGGEPFIDGQAVPYDPKYHEEWVRNNAKAQERNRRNDRPRNADRSRNFDRRQQGGRGPPNTGGAPPNMPPNNVGYAQNMPPPNNAGYGQNMPPPNNAGYGQNMPPPNNAGYGQNMPPPNNAGYGNPGYAQNRGNAPPPNYGGQGNAPPPNYGGQGNPGYAGNTRPNQQPGGGMPYQNAPQNYAPQNSNMGGQQGPPGAYQQDVPGRDGPNYQ